MAQQKPSWKPRRRGPVYCAPACGAGCTIVAYDRAGFIGLEWQKKLGPGWKIHVWENMGWFVKLTKGNLEIHPPQAADRTDSVHVFLNPTKTVGGMGNFTVHHKDPLRAMRKLIAEAAERKANLEEAINIAETVVKELAKHRKTSHGVTSQAVQI